MISSLVRRVVHYLLTAHKLRDSLLDRSSIGFIKGLYNYKEVHSTQDFGIIAHIIENNNGSSLRVGQ